MLDNQPRGTICIEDLEIGMVRSLRKTVTDRDIDLFPARLQRLQAKPEPRSLRSTRRRTGCVARHPAGR